MIWYIILSFKIKVTFGKFNYIHAKNWFKYKFQFTSFLVFEEYINYLLNKYKNNSVIKDIIKNDNRRMLEAFSSITGKPYKTVVEDFAKKNFMNPTQAKKYGLIDGIIRNKK